MAMSDSTKLVLAVMAGAAVIAVLMLIPSSPPDIRSPQAAEFRHEARIVYANALKESCPPVKQWPRAKVLAAQRQALAEFESDHAGPLGAQLQIAHDDAIPDLGCWADERPEFARIHVQLARTMVTRGLAKLEQLAPQIGTGFFAAPASRRSAQLFRRAAHRAVGIANPGCRLSSRADDDTVLAAAQDALAEFRKELGKSARASDFDIAEADVLYEDSITEWECGDPSDEPVARLSQDELGKMRRSIADMRKLL